MKSTALLRVLQATFSFLTVASCTDSQQPLQGNLHSQHIAGGRACQDDIPTSTFDYCQYCTSTTTTTSGYTITHTPCVPTSKYVRTATGLNAPEISWQSKRSVSAVKAMATYFPSAWGANNPQYNLTQLLKDPPRIGLAFSGGGFRAMLGGAGVLQAYDTSPNGGIAGVSGILDSSLYITGLSGGGWLVGSWALNGYPNVTTLNEKWNLMNDNDESLIYQWGDGDAICYGVQCEAEQKYHSGAPISFADAWSRLIARNILNGVPANSTWSGLLSSTKLSSGAAPLPILQSIGRTDTEEYEYDGTVFEITPFEFGSWDPLAIGAFVQMDKLGTRLWNGQSQKSTCVSRFDNAAFMMGASSLAIAGSLIDDGGFTIAEASANIPNPFCAFGDGSQTDCTTPNAFQTLYLDDGGDSGQNIPLLPLLERDRNMDALIAVDMSADEGDLMGICCGYNWPQAYSLNWTLAYALSPAGRAQGIAVPTSLPSPADIDANPALVYTPTFFGCNASDSTVPGVTPPLIVYLPNAPYTAYSNGTTSSTAGWEWGTVAADLITNGAALASTGIPPTMQSQPLPTWGTCLACALADRARERMRPAVPRSKQCEACFTAYCAEKKAPVDGLWDPVTNFYSPPPIANNFETLAQPLDDTYCYIYPDEEYWFEGPKCNPNCSYESPFGCPDWDSQRKGRKVEIEYERDEL